MEMNYYTGTSGLLLPVPNKQFYPEAFKDKSRLSYYASLVNSIEINSSFYKIPQASTINRWTTEVPNNFRFTFKLFKGITHQKDLAFDESMVAHFMQVISAVGYQKGCLLVQFPPSVRIAQFRQIERLIAVLRDNDPSAEWNMALEFRYPSLYIDEVYEILETYGCGMVIHDKKPASSPLLETHPDFMFLRFHGPNGDYRERYSDQLLAEYASYIGEWLADGKKVFAYFNNTMGEALDNLNTLRKMVNDGLS